jgi:tetratricopeptide (TPR) repeat protein
MKNDCVDSSLSRNIFQLLGVLGLSCFCLTTLSPPVKGKEPSLTAIVVYQNGSAWTYLQASDILFNAKTEIRDCGVAQSIDRSAYGKLPKIRLAAPASLEVLDNGSLRYTKDDASTCVVADNLKFDKNGSFTPAQLASRATIEGKSIGPPSALPSFRPGMLIVFVPAPDVEFAEFLVASRASQIPLWDAYITKYPDGGHIKEARVAFAHLLVKQSRAHLEVYKSSESLATPALPELQAATQLASKANLMLPSDLGVKAINADVVSAMDEIFKKANAELQSYRQALSTKTAGYGHLRNANRFLDQLRNIDPKEPSVLKFQADTEKETDAYESAVHSAQKLISSSHVDDALKAVSPYLSFLSEDSRIADVVNSSYSFHFNKGKSFSYSNNWTEASREFELAEKIKPSSEAAAALANTKKELEKARNESAAETARQQSKEDASRNDFIAAYEVLANLPPDQRALVAADIDQLGPAYVKSASQASQQIQKAHDPVRGLADEKEIEKAYGYLDRAYAIDGQSTFKERRDDLGDKLSEYYLQQARRYIAKPLGSGVCVGWSYLEKAMRYKASNLESVREEQTKTSAAYQMRSRLSIRVEFRDQTSRHDSIGFAEQLGDAIATGLENSGLPVKIVRSGDNPIVEPNFRLVGDVIQHRKSNSTSSESKESKYLAGEEPIPNDQWNAANREYEAAKMELESARSVLQVATARTKKKEITDAGGKVKAAETKVKADLEKLDSIPKNTMKDIIKPYSYTEKRSKLSATVELRYRIFNSSGQTIETSDPISGANSQTVITLENVKPEDTENVKVQGTMPDENEFLIDVENGVRDALIKAARMSVQNLRDKIFAMAQLREKEGDFDAAGESYILYLNSTPPLPTPERIQGESFLSQRFNIRIRYGAF